MPWGDLLYYFPSFKMHMQKYTLLAPLTLLRIPPLAQGPQAHTSAALLGKCGPFLQGWEESFHKTCLTKGPN